MILFYFNQYYIILRQDPEVCPDSQRASGYDDDDDDDDDDAVDDDADHRYAPHKQDLINPH